MNEKSSPSGHSLELDFRHEQHSIRVSGQRMPDGTRATQLWINHPDSSPLITESIEPFFKGPFLDAEPLFSLTTKPPLICLLLPWLSNPAEEIQRFWHHFSGAETQRQDLWNRGDRSRLRPRELRQLLYEVNQFPTLPVSRKIKSAEWIVRWLLEGMNQDPARFRSLYEVLNGDYPLAIHSPEPTDYSAEGVEIRILRAKALLLVRRQSAAFYSTKSRVLECLASSIQNELTLPTKKALRMAEGIQEPAAGSKVFKAVGLQGLPEA